MRMLSLQIPRTKLVLVVRTDLQMSTGKVAAQCGHAAVGAVQNFGQDQRILDLWRATGQTKVAVRATSEMQLVKISQLADAAEVNTFIVRDAGATQVDTGTATVLAVGPAEINQMDALTGSLRLL